MKIKKIALIIGLSLISFQTFAATGHDFEILSETETVSPGLQASHKNITGQKKSASPFYAAPMARVETQKVRVNTTSKLTGYHEASVKNTTRYNKKYAFDYVLFTDKDTYKLEKKVLVKPGGVFMDVEETSIDNYVRYKIGKYWVSAETVIYSDDPAQVARSRADVIVTR